MFLVPSCDVCLLLKKNVLIPNVAEKNILILVEGEKKSDSEFLSYNLMLNSGKKFARLARQKINSNSRVVRKKISKRSKNHNPPCKLNGRSLTLDEYENLIIHSRIQYVLLELTTKQ